MANWYGAARSNYVRIKDMEGLKAALSPFPIKISIRAVTGLTCFLSEEVDSGGWPSYALVSNNDNSDEGDSEVEFQPNAHITPFMEEGEILVMQECGHEKLRYLSGSMEAYDHLGNRISLSLDDIYVTAAKHFNKPIGEITRCEY